MTTKSDPMSKTGDAFRCPPRAGGVAAVIPAYRPGPVLIDLIHALRAGDWEAIVVVDDGSGPEYAHILREVAQIPKVQVVSHAINLGKGSALKAGINFALCACPGLAGIVTIDADGQHDPADVLAVCRCFLEAPSALVLGVRDFSGAVPLPNKLGNLITRRLMRALLGHVLSDTQTGLRAIPHELLLRLMKVPATGYEFELEMLVAVKHLGLRVTEHPIRTIYEPGNPTSHFRPWRDSMRIYWVLFRFSLISLATASLDNAVFYLLFHWTGSIFGSQAGARCAAVMFQYPLVRRAVFFSSEGHRVLFPRFLLLVAVNAALSYAGIRALTQAAPVSVPAAKILCEALLFLGNFMIQRDIIFTRRAR